MTNAIPVVNANGAEIPVIGFGTWQLKGDDALSGTAHALELGYRHIDTAQIYENEAEVGRAIAESGVARDDLFVTTKLWSPKATSTQELVDTMAGSLDRLQLDRVDLVLIHWPPTAMPVEGCLEALEQVLAAEQTRFVGISNFTIALQAQAFARLPQIVCNQVEYHPYLAQDGVLEGLRTHKAGLVAYSPLGRGKVADDETLSAIGARYGKTAAQVTLRWFVQQANVIALPRSSSPERRRENFEVFDFQLSDDDMKQVAGLARGERMISPDFAPAWDD